MSFTPKAFRSQTFRTTFCLKENTIYFSQNDFWRKTSSNMDFRDVRALWEISYVTLSFPRDGDVQKGWEIATMGVFYNYPVLFEPTTTAIGSLSIKGM